MIDSFPATLPPPEPLVRFFRWLEDNSLAERSPYDDQWYARLDPAIERACVLVTPVDPKFAVAWRGDENPELARRMAVFIRTGGDGSYAGLWQDDNGRVSFVHQGSGSGSTLLCELTDNPVDFLRLLAIGYEELCWEEVFDFPPDEAYRRGWAEDEQDVPVGPARPLQFQRWVTESFGVTIPRTASEIVKSTAGMDDAESDDPFWNWIRKVQSQ
jgi:hypothetical protein